MLHKSRPRKIRREKFNCFPEIHYMLLMDTGSRSDSVTWYWLMKKKRTNISEEFPILDKFGVVSHQENVIIRRD